MGEIRTGGIPDHLIKESRFILKTYLGRFERTWALSRRTKNTIPRHSSRSEWVTVGTDAAVEICPAIPEISGLERMETGNDISTDRTI